MSYQERIEVKLARSAGLLFMRRKIWQSAMCLVILIGILWLTGGLNNLIPAAAGPVTSANILSNNASQELTTDYKVSLSGLSIGEKVVVSHVVDGDTLDYMKDGKKHRVRLIGINTPEVVDPKKSVECFGPEASAEAKAILLNKNIILMGDSKEFTDKYGRELRYVFLPDGTSINAMMIGEGYAFATPKYRFDEKDNFVNLENRAKMAQKGLWNVANCKY